MLARPQFIVPLGVFADNAGLVEIFLAPVDREIARGDMAELRVRRPARHQQQRNPVAIGIHQCADRIAGADRDVNHDRRGLAGREVMAVRHRHREVLVRHGHDRRNGVGGVADAAYGLDDRREIGAGIGEQRGYAVGAQAAQQDFGVGDPGRDRLAHRARPSASSRR
jgi:hypothetical protein